MINQTATPPTAMPRASMTISAVTGGCPSDDSSLPRRARCKVGPQRARSAERNEGRCVEQQPINYQALQFRQRINRLALHKERDPTEADDAEANQSDQQIACPPVAQPHPSQNYGCPKHETKG